MKPNHPGNCQGPETRERGDDFPRADRYPDEDIPPGAGTSWAGPETGGTLFLREVKFPGATGWGLDANTDVYKSGSFWNGTCGAKRVHATIVPDPISSDDSIWGSSRKKHSRSFTILGEVGVS